MRYVLVCGVLLMLAVAWVSVLSRSDGRPAVQPAPFPGSPASLSDVAEPVHDWTVNLGGHAYGLGQWGHSDCSIYVGRRVVTLDVPAGAVATLGSVVCAIAAWGAVSLVSRCARK